MKKKVGELYDKPIVIGNPNDFTKNEIPLSELNAGGNGGSNNIKYYNLPSNTNVKQTMSAYSMIVKLDSDDQKALYGAGQIIEMLMDGESSISEFYEYVVSCAVDFDALYVATPEEGELKIKDILLPEVISSIGLVEITKEEFYNLNA